MFIYYSRSKVLPANLEELLRKLGHVCPNLRQSLTAIGFNPIKEIKHYEPLRFGDPNILLDTQT